jgi:hypothetical protein
VADTYRYALPPDYNGGLIKIRDMTNDREVVLWTPDLFDTRYPDVSEEDSDEPIVATIKNMELWLNCPAGGVYRLELEYGRSGDDNTTTDMAWLPEIERFRCCDFAIFQSFRSLHMWQEAALYQQDWMQGIMKARRADGKRRWARMGYQLPNWIQVAQARGYQQSVEDA